MEKVYDYIKNCGVYYLATTDNNQPRVRPFGTVDIFDGKLYIQTGKVKPTYAQLKNNPLAEICCFNGESWIRLSGELIEDDRVEAKKHMLDAYPNLRAMYNENDGNTAVFYFNNAKAVISGFGKEPETIEL